MSVTIVGMGMCGTGTLTREAWEALCRADAVVGAKRLLDLLPESVAASRHFSPLPEEMAKIAAGLGQKSVCVLVSGDSGFFSGAAVVLKALGGREVRVLPGISSVSYFASKLGRPWQDWKLLSAHGRDCDAPGAVRRHSETFFLTGGDMTARSICKALAEHGFGSLRVTVGENLGGPDERIKSGTAEEMGRTDHAPLSVVLVDNPCPDARVFCGYPDEAFVRGDVPMTKSEVRAVVISKLRLREDDTVFDIGAGTGSVSVEAALLARRGRVFAVERGPEGCGLIRENARRFCVSNLTVVEGEAPEALDGLPPPDAAFIGGSGGRLGEIVERLVRANPAVRLAVAAVTLETLEGARAALGRAAGDVEVVQVSVSRARPAGGHSLLKAANPVFIISRADAGT